MRVPPDAPYTACPAGPGQAAGSCAPHFTAGPVRMPARGAPPGPDPTRAARDRVKVSR
ncbi:hypothetical protein [Streptomyces sp. NPDC002104]